MMMGLRKLQMRGPKETKRVAVIALSDLSFWQRILGRYRVAGRWRLPLLSFRSARMRSVAGRIDFALSIFFGPFSLNTEKRFFLTFPGRAAGQPETFSLLQRQPFPGMTLQFGGGYARGTRDSRSSFPRLRHTRKKPGDEAAEGMGGLDGSGRGPAPEGRAFSGMISRGLLTVAGEMRVAAPASLPLLLLRERHGNHDGGGEREAGIPVLKFPARAPGLLQGKISAADTVGSRRFGKGQTAPALAFAGSRQTAPFGKDGGSLRFLSLKRLEQEIDVIRKRVDNTREVLSEQIRRPLKAPDGTMKPAVDMNRICDHVYREIERRIRTERERRGM